MATIRWFINYSFDLEALDRLKKPARHPAGGHEERKPTNREPLAQTLAQTWHAMTKFNSSNL